MPQIASGNVAGARMKLNVGGVERRATSTSSYAYRLTQVNFTYTVVAADVDADGISLPANSIIISGASWAKVGGGFLNHSHSALSSQSAHRVFGTAAYLSATNPSSLTEANLNGATVTVSLGGLTYASGVSASSFALVTTPAIAGLTVSNVTGGARTVTVTAQDADANRAAGDRDTLTFQVTVLDSPTVAASPTAANPAPFPAPPVV